MAERRWFLRLIQALGWNQIACGTTKARPHRKPASHLQRDALWVHRSRKVHRPVLTFCSMALTIASQCFLLGCASRSSAPTVKDLPQPDTSSVRVSGADPAFATPANEGRSMPLHKAVLQLVPTDYAVRWIDVEPARRNATVTWNANQEWPAAIAQAVASAPGLTVDIGTGSRLVLIRQAPSQLRPSPAVALTAPAAASAIPPLAVASARKKKEKATEAVPAVPQAQVDGVVRLQPVGLRAGATPELVVMKARPPVPANRWELSERDKTLKGVVERWAQDAGWRAFWELDVDYPIAATASIDGSFEEAVSTVVRSMDHADVPLKAIFYRGNQVLRMVPRGME